MNKLKRLVSGVLATVMMGTTAIAAPVANHTNDVVANFNRAEGAVVYENYAMNQSFDKDTYGVSTFGGTAGINTLNALFGKGSLSWVSPSGTDNMRIKTKAVPKGTNGKLCQVIFQYGYPYVNGVTEKDQLTVEIQNSAGNILAPTTAINATYELAESTAVAEYKSNAFRCPYNGTTPANSYVEAVFKRTRSQQLSFFLDEFMFKVGDGYGTSRVDYGPTAFTPSVQAQTVGASPQCTESRTGAFLDVNCTYVASAVTSGDFRFNLPGSKVISRAIKARQVVKGGLATRSVATASTRKSIAVFMNGGNNYVDFSNIEFGEAGGTASIMTGNWVVAGETLNVTFSVPIEGWEGGTAVTPQNGANLIGTQFYTKASTCPVNSVSANSTITRAQYPDLFTAWNIPAGTDSYVISEAGLVIRAAGTQTLNSKTYTANLGDKRNDALAAHTHEYWRGGLVGGSGYPSGTANGAGSVSTGSTGTGTETHGADVALTSCYWAVSNPFLPIALETIKNAPGVLTTDAPYNLKKKRAKITCSSTSTIVDQYNDSWLTSVGNNSGGICTIVWPSTTWPVAPQCFTEIVGAGANSWNKVISAAETTTGMSIATYVSNTTAGVANYTFNLWCEAQRP